MRIEITFSKLYYLWGAFLRSHDVHRAINCRKSTNYMDFGNFVAKVMFMSLLVYTQHLACNIFIYYVIFHISYPKTQKIFSKVHD